MRRLAFLCALFLIVPSTPLPAQPTFRVSPSVGAGLTASPEAFDQFYSSSPQFGLGVEYVASRNVGVHARLHYARLFLSRDGITNYFNKRVEPQLEELLINGPAGSILGGSLSLELRTRLPRDLVFHGLIGIGLYQQSLYGVTVANTDAVENGDLSSCGDGCLNIRSLSQTSPGLSIGARLSTSIWSRFRPFLEAKYTIIFSERAAEQLYSEELEAISNDFVGTTGYFPLQAGLSIGI